MESFQNKVVIVTGGSKGIGEGCARVFCRAGAQVVICARHEAPGRQLADELSDTGPGKCVFRKCDVSDTTQIEHLVSWTVHHFGRLDCLINNAGWHPPEQAIDEFSVKDFEDLLRLNLVSIFAGCKHALPHLRKTGGSIINMSSLVGAIGQKSACTYAATKGAINALTKALAIDECKHGVRINAVLPAGVITPLYDEALDRAEDPKALSELVSGWHWLGRCASIDEVANVCLFLASDAASFITGVELPVSGGAELGYGTKQL